MGLEQPLYKPVGIGYSKAVNSDRFLVEGVVTWTRMMVHELELKTILEGSTFLGFASLHYPLL
jgi:hypothetical protein